MVELVANSGDPDQTPRSAASDLGLHGLPITLLGVSRLQWIKRYEPGTRALQNCLLRTGFHSFTITYFSVV